MTFVTFSPILLFFRGYQTWLVRPLALPGLWGVLLVVWGHCYLYTVSDRCCIWQL